MNQSDLFDPRVADAIDQCDASVRRDQTAERLVALLMDWCRHQLTVSGDDLGTRLDAMGVQRTGDEGNRLRRRIVSVTINRLRGTKELVSAGKIRGRAGRDIELWRVVRP